jgi:radical SAM family uncharacterized protein/radical SAM-linked protein
VEVRRFDHPYSEFLDRVEKPTRYTGREHGVHRKAWDDVQARICLAFPDIYDIGMSHLGYRILYRLLNEDPRTLAERCYAPWIDLARELRERQLPLVSLESYRPLREFDVVGFSLQFELCHTNVLAMLELGGIALRTADRDENAPLVIAGGPVATHPEPVAPFFDAILIGDGEKAAADIALTWVEGKKLGKTREQRLRALAELPGVYVPSLYETAIDARSGLEVVVSAKAPEAPLPVRRHIVGDLAAYPFPTTGPVGGPEAIFDRMSVEVARGCTEGCRFCQAGMIYRPVRERPPEQVIDAVMTAVQNSGQDEVSLTALSTADVSYISPLIKSLTKRTAPERISLGVASLRAYGLDEDLLDELRKVRASGLTFAPEAGTQRMRDVINKNVTEDQLLETAERVFSRGWDRMKLYFILGLPTETDEDLEGIVQCGQRAMEVGRRVAKKRLTITVSVSVHVPKPHTPFQWCAMDSLSEIRRKQALLRQMMRGSRGIELKIHESVASVLECILARGDRRVADVIERAYQNGARFDSWDDQFQPEVWDEALNHFGIDRAIYLGTLPVEANLPWSHIDVGLDPDFLPREYKKALKSRLSPPCGKPVGMHAHHTNLADVNDDQRKLVCYDCGIECDLTEMRERRSEYLVSLGALTRPERKPVKVEEPTLEAGEDGDGQTLAALPVEDATAPTTSPNPDPTADVSSSQARGLSASDPERFRPEQPRENAERWRLRFAKTGTASMLGHLDLIRELPRSFRRANLRVAYSRGFHPKPELSFAPALSLGVPSLDEFVDATLLDPPHREELLARLRGATSGGLHFEDAARLPERAPTLSKTIGAGRYALVVPRALVNDIGGIPAIETRIQSFLSETSVFLLRQVDRAKKRVDVRKHVISIGFGDDVLLDHCRKAGLLGEFLTLDVLIGISPEGSSKATEVGLALFGEAGATCRAVRVALLDHAHLPLAQRFHGDVFDVEVPAIAATSPKAATADAT